MLEKCLVHTPPVCLQGCPVEVVFSPMFDCSVGRSRVDGIQCQKGVALFYWGRATVQGNLRQPRWTRHGSKVSLTQTSKDRSVKLVWGVGI
jgi:hypothetical protein